MNDKKRFSLADCLDFADCFEADIQQRYKLVAKIAGTDRASLELKNELTAVRILKDIFNKRMIRMCCSTDEDDRDELLTLVGQKFEQVSEDTLKLYSNDDLKSLLLTSAGKRTKLTKHLLHVVK